MEGIPQEPTLPENLNGIFKLKDQKVMVFSTRSGDFVAGWSIIGNPYKENGEWMVSLTKSDENGNPSGKKSPVKDVLEWNKGIL